mgnify:CR=1 FL=1
MAAGSGRTAVRSGLRHRPDPRYWPGPRYRPGARHRAGLIAGLTLAVLAAAAPDRAPAAPPAAPPGWARVVPAAGAVQVVVQGTVVLSLRGPDALRRAAEVVRRLEVAAAVGSPLAVAVAVHAGGADLLLNGHRLVTVDPPQAAAHAATPEALAAVWAGRLVQALARPAVLIAPARLLLPPGAVATVQVRVFPPAPLRVGPHDEQVAQARLGAPGVLVVEGRRPGSVLIPLLAGLTQVGLAVTVRAEAGILPEAVTVTVTGKTLDPGLVAEAVTRRIDQLTVRQPGAVLTVGPIPPLPELPPPEGGNGPPAEPIVLEVPARLQSPYALPVSRLVPATVLHETVAVRDPTVLLVSNRPEVVVANGVLFQDVVDGAHPTRLLYHHMNGSPHARILTVSLGNRGDRPARLLLLRGLAGPSPDPLYVGHVATLRFLRAVADGQGYVLELPPRSTYTFTAQGLAPRQLVSGILQVQLLEGEALEVALHIRSPWLLQGTVTSEVNQPAYPHPRGTFQLTTVTVGPTVDVTRAAVLVDLGTWGRPRDLRTGEVLVGDYGILYRLAPVLVNPQPRELSVDLTATAAGGPARGVFLIAGEVVELGVLRAGESQRLATWTLAAGETRAVEILTMPAAGSFYPVRLALRPHE